MTASFGIVVGLDFREAGGYAFGQAARIARAIPGGAIHLVHVFESAIDDARKKQLISQLRTYANEKGASVGGLAGTTVGIHLRVGDPVREIAQLASDVGANMIVIGAHKEPHLKNWLLGSVSHKLISAASCPVLVAGPKPQPVHHEPAIEAPCPDCDKARAASKGATWWCERHAHHAAHAHTFSYQREIPLATHDSEVIPTGIDFS